MADGGAHLSRTHVLYMLVEKVPVDAVLCILTGEERV